MSPRSTSRTARISPFLPSLVFLSFLWTPSLRLGRFANAYPLEGIRNLDRVASHPSESTVNFAALDDGMLSCRFSADAGRHSDDDSNESQWRREFDICDLFDKHYEVVVDLEEGSVDMRNLRKDFFCLEAETEVKSPAPVPEKRKYTYNLTLNGRGKGKGSECGEGTWLCLSETITTQENLLTTDRVIAGLDSDNSRVNAIVPTFDNNDHSSSFELFLTGQYAGARPHPQYALVRFTCPNSQDVGLRFVHYDSHSGIHSFEWSTPNACPTGGVIAALDTGSDEEGRPEGDDDKQKEGEDLQLKDSASAAARRRVALALFLLITFAVFGLALSTSPILRQKTVRILNRTQSTIISALPFLNTFVPYLSFAGQRSRERSQYTRIDQNRLVRWAQEDMTITTTGLRAGAGQEDHMVNFSPTSSHGPATPIDGSPEIGNDKWNWDDIDLGEYIPLTPKKKSSRAITMWKDSVKNYGSAVDSIHHSPYGAGGRSPLM